MRVSEQPSSRRPKERHDERDDREPDARAAVRPGAGRPARRAERRRRPSPGATIADIEEALKDVVDPELGINVVDLGLIYGLDLEDDGSLTIDMTLTSAACPLTDVIEDQTDTALEGLVERFVINWVWMPPWGMEKITDDGREQLRALGFNV